MVPMGQGGMGRYTPSLDPTNGKGVIFSHLSFSHLIFFLNFPSVKKKTFLFSCFSLIWDENETLKYSSGPRRCLASSINTAACILIAGLLVSGERIQLCLDPALSGVGPWLPSLPRCAGQRCGMRCCLLSRAARLRRGSPPVCPMGQRPAGPVALHHWARLSIPSRVSLPDMLGPRDLWVLCKTQAVGAFDWFVASRWH